MDATVLARLLEVYEEIDRQTAALKGTTGLRCPPGCGTCCSFPELQATELEMLPVAEELFRRREAVSWLERLRGADDEGPCAFYEPERSARGEGCCGIYILRPAVCRLFGYGAANSKYGIVQLAVCAVMKQVMPHAARDAVYAVERGLSAPRFIEFAHLVAGLEPALGERLLPINRALRMALEREGLALQLEKGGKGES
ncbi:MAG TPA: YkgJ family cysteine cluster protein [Syntrophobacteria bacterium]|nr:YkgJ family cysteine cluster protein [Syntrophobacteria bacterium]